MSELQDDIDFLEEILEKAENNDMHDHLDAMQMLRDQISHMQKRNITIDAADAKNRCICMIGSQFCEHYLGDGMCGA